MPPKRRILVVFEPDREAKRVKLAVSVDKEATNGTLAHEIAETVGAEGVKLEVGDGFELRLQDGVDMILDSDVVVARPCQPQHLDARLNSPVHPASSHLEKGKDREEQEQRRFQIHLVSAELARAHAAETLKETTEPANGVAAFGGEFVSGNTTISALRQEAEAVLGWKPFGSSFEDDPCNHELRDICSCAVAHEVELHGLSSALHCRFSINGTRCAHDECSYSHVPISQDRKAGLDAPHCSVCADALAFPCPSCLNEAQMNGIEPGAVVHCAIVKNAGCGHLHHAHCLGPMKAASSGCPSGCPSSSVHREAVPFDQDVPTITLVWDGDKIERLPIPPNFTAALGSMQYLGTGAVISTVKSFLETKSLNLSALSLRIHARAPDSDVCSSVLHKNPDYRRFPFPGPATSLTPTKGRGKLFEIDLHTTSCPIIVCGCTRIKDVFPSNGLQSGDAMVTLYAVKRRCDNSATPGSKHAAVPTTKQSAYQLNSAWQPSVVQTPRGMAALLSSLLVLSETVRKQGVTSENKILTTLFSITRFPPAVRALGVLLLNVAPQPQEKAALAEALFHALQDFSHAASPAFTINPSRRFETARILLGHILAVTDIVNATARPLRSFSLKCAISNKRLVDPVTLDSFAIVERSSGILHAVGGQLYRPGHGVKTFSITELSGNELHQVVAQSKEYNGSEVYVLLVHELGVVSRPMTLKNVGRDFSNAIQRANETDLISRGPLELKSPSVVPPQVVLDSEGFLAVFMGRGCGAARDVNFFRPASGGETEVDVNDVEHALQKVIAARKVEDTWDVDCFGGIPAKARTPDEAIILCLDLSQSMNEKSAVGHSGAEGAFNHRTEGIKAVDEVVQGLNNADILIKAKEWLQEQHESCYVAWKSHIEEDEMPVTQLVDHLGTIVQRAVLEHKLSGAFTFDKRLHLMRASFSSASRSQIMTIADFLESFLENYEPSAILGVAPYDIPRNLVDPTTGDILKTGANTSPNARWISGEDILESLKSEESMSLDTVKITVQAQGTKPTTWELPVDTSTRVLYSLANRATEAQFSSFTLRDCNTLQHIQDSANLRLSSTALRSGGSVETYWTMPHSRKPLEITVTVPVDFTEETITLPADAPALALISSVRGPDGYVLSDIRLWHGLKDVGDGMRHGALVGLDSDISRMTSLECDFWHWAGYSASHESRSLSRLELQKELFNIFLNRVALLKQELTPIFENFRLELDKVTANGDTSMYDALDLARSCLINFRRDLPNLRRRIIIVSDGKDTSSESLLSEVGSALQRDRVIVDSVQVGQTLSDELHRVSAATGGYRFFPQASLGDALSIFDLETMMNSAERTSRPKMLRAFSKRLNQNVTANKLSTYPIDIVTIDQFPRRAQHPRLADRAKPVREAVGADLQTLNSDHTRRIMRELKALHADPHPQIDVYVTGDDLSFLQVVIQAPDDIEQCPYKGGCFLLTCDIPPEYPRHPPEIRFVTFILHPNVSKQGKVCVAELSRLWSSDITLKELLSLVYGLLLEPDLDNPLEIQASLKYCRVSFRPIVLKITDKLQPDDDDGTFALAAAKAVNEHASKSRSSWRKELEI
ncbi:hypothetical protein DXG01_015978 [Tephrocybe rancida]|nr:hypothetical protein DXG01_015978 [Tephrocybe rancida]